MIGQLLQERFRIDARIGRWCGSEVYRAMDLQHQQPVLVRILSAAYASNESLWAQVVARAQQMAMIEHPGILRLQSIGRDGDVVYLVQSYVQATPLAELWQPGGALPAREQVLVGLRQLAEALDAMHQAGVTHGALCPACILVDDNSGALLLDGMAAAALQGADKATRDTVALYAAPEQIGPQAAAPPADRYALAALAFEWLTGQSPHAEQSTAALPYEQQTALAAPSATRVNPALPRAVDGAFASLLSPNPSKRPQSALAVAERLTLALQGAESSGHAAPRWLWGFVGTIAALLLVVGGVWALVRHGDLGGTASTGDEQGLIKVATLSTSQPTPTTELLPTATLPAATNTPLPPTDEPTVEGTATATDEPTRRPTTPVTTVPTTPPAPVPTTDPSAATLACTTAPSGPFVALWKTYQDALGCPLDSEPLAGSWAEEPFENGHMYWSEDADLFLVTIGDGSGTWLTFPDDASAWQEGMPVKTCDLEEPSGMDLPVRGFGQIWCTDDAIRAGLGWATDTERGFGGGIVLLQRFENGYILRDSDGNTTGEAYVLSSTTGTYVRIAY